MQPAANSAMPAYNAQTGGAEAIASAGYVPIVARIRSPANAISRPEGATVIPSGRPPSSAAYRISAGFDGVEVRAGMIELREIVRGEVERAHDAVASRGRKGVERNIERTDALTLAKEQDR